MASLRETEHAGFSNPRYDSLRSRILLEAYLTGQQLIPCVGHNKHNFMIHPGAFQGRLDLHSTLT
jgi:hypothetical protein